MVDPQAKAQPKVGDLIEVPDLRTVVRLADVDDGAQAQTLARDFVFTEDTVRALRLLSRSFAQPGGEGFFLIGSYGSGKSHLLSVLSLWAEAGPKARLGLPADLKAELKEGLQGAIFPKKLLAVRASLVDHRGNDPLEECVLAAAERRLDAAQRNLALTPARQHLERLTEALSPQEAARLDEFLRARKLPPLATFSRQNPREAVARAREFMRDARIDLPARLQDERPALFARLIGEARDAGYDGVLLLIDELSEFLRSKPTTRTLAEDGRFLQFLGEAGRTAPLWVVASLQEALEETGDLARPVLEKIKDRYPVRLRLTTTHVEDLVSGRLVRKKPGAGEVLKALHARLAAHFPDLKLSAERFARLYPLHPRTLAYLEGLSDLFSQARGVVEFVTTHLRGDPLRSIPGLLERDAATLLGVDSIFDHFEARLREHESYAPYYRKAYLHLAKRIETLFSDPEDRRAALRLVKVLVLTELNPLEGRKTVKELAEILLTQVSDLDPRLNYQYLDEAILKPLYEGSDYLRREPGSGEFGDRYGLDLALDVRSLLKERVEARLASARGDEVRLLRRLFSEVGGGAVPLDRLARGERVSAHVRWLNTEREGELVLGEPADLGEDRLEAVLKRLEEEESDFLVVLREPAAEPRPLPPVLDRADVLVWTPAPVDDAVLRELLEAAVHRALLLESRGATEEETRLRELLSEEVEKGTSRVRERLASLYLKGSLTPARTIEGLLPLEAPPQARSLEETLTQAVGRALGEAHPDFRRVMPQTEYVNPRALTQALAELAGSGHVTSSAARSKGVLAVIEGVLLPLGLASLKRGSYALAPDETAGSLAHALLADLAEAERLPYRRVFLKLRKGGFGLTTLLARTVLLALVQSGHVVAYRSGKAVAAQYLSYETLPTVEELSLGRLVDRGVQDELRTLQFLLAAPLPEFWGLKTQRDVWQALIDFKTRTGERLERLRAAYARYAGVGAFRHFDWERLSALTRPLAELAQAVHSSHDSRQGIESVLAAQREVALDEPKLRSVEAAERFFQGDVERLLFLHGYVSDPALDALPEPWTGEVAALREGLAELTDLVLDGEVSLLSERFERLREGYRQAYAQAHHAEVGEAAFKDVEQVRGCPELRALEALGLAESLSVPHDHVRLSRLIDKALARRCRRDAAAEVYTKPACACGFRLGEKVEKPPPAELRALAREGIVEYAGELHHPERRARLLAHASALEGTDRAGSGEALRKLVRALDQGAPAKELLLLVDRRLGEALAEALAGRQSVVERDVLALVEDVAERKLTVDKLREAFERWLNPSAIEPGAYVHVVEGEAAPAGSVLAPEAAAGRVAEAPEAEGERPAAPRKRRLRRPQLLALGIRAWAAARKLDPDAVARRLQLGEAALPPDPARTLAELGPELDQVLVRDPALREGLNDVLGIDRLDAVALAGEILREPALEGVRALALDRMTALVLAREARAETLPDLGGAAFPRPAPGARPPISELYALIRRALVVAETRNPRPRDLLEGILAFDAAATLGTRTGALEAATVRALLDRMSKLDALGEREPPDLPPLPDLLETTAGDEPSLVLLVDALRFDLWRALRPVFEEALSRRVSVEELRLAPKTSTTEAGRARLFGLKPGESVDLLGEQRGMRFVVAAERGHNARDLQRALAGDEARRRTVWLNLLDDKVHASTLSPWGICEAVAGELAVTLAPELKRVPRGTRVFLAADHGFRENATWPRSKERYAHGGPSLLERAVPFVVFG